MFMLCGALKMDRDLGSILDESPWESDTAILLLKGLAEALRSMHNSGDRWDQSELGVHVAEDLRILKIGSLSERNRHLEPGKIDATKDFVAPEYFSNGIEDTRSDIWAWGHVAYELVTGKRPFTGESVFETMTAMLKSEAVAPSLVEPKCFKALSDVISRSLTRDPNGRFQSVEELIGALEKASR